MKPYNCVQTNDYHIQIEMSECYISYYSNEILTNESNFGMK